MKPGMQEDPAGIAIGGCYPPGWPLPEPEPGAHDLGQPVDWLTYSHRELYDMVTQDVDVSGAMSVAAQWAKLSDQLADLSDDLSRAITATEPGWGGAAADAARDVVHRLADWAERTGASANEVSGSVSRQADNAATARWSMPEPPPDHSQLPPDPSDPWSKVEPYLVEPRYLRDPGTDSDKSVELHRQAAEVMSRFQSDSNYVYDNVPTFDSPASDGPRDRQPPPAPPKQEPPSGNDSDSTRTSSSVGTPVTGGGELGQGAHSGGANPGVREQIGAGGRTGSAGPPGLAAGPSPAAAAQRAPAHGMGAMPMGGMPGGAAGRGEDTEHTRASYLLDDDDAFWMPDVSVSPPVLGDDPPAPRGAR